MSRFAWSITKGFIETGLDPSYRCAHPRTLPSGLPWFIKRSNRTLIDSSSILQNPNRPGRKKLWEVGRRQSQGTSGKRRIALASPAPSSPGASREVPRCQQRVDGLCPLTDRQLPVCDNSRFSGPANQRTPPGTSSPLKILHFTEINDLCRWSVFCARCRNPRSFVPYPAFRMKLVARDKRPAMPPGTSATRWLGRRRYTKRSAREAATTGKLALYLIFVALVELLHPYIWRIGDSDVEASTRRHHFGELDAPVDDACGNGRHAKISAELHFRQPRSVVAAGPCGLLRACTVP